MSDYRGTRVKTRLVWELLFSWHLSLAAVTASLFAWRLAYRLAQMEIAINHFLHIRQTDLVRGHLSVWIPTILLGMSVWAFLRAASGVRATDEFLRTLAGLITLAAPSAFWVLAYNSQHWSFDWPKYLALFENAITLLSALLFLNGRWKAPKWIVLLGLALHYGIWYAEPSTLFFSDYGGLPGPLLGFSAAASWVAYLSTRGIPKATSTSVMPP
jgi:hypothetical protein